MAKLLIEIGLEELPARFIEPALAAFDTALDEFLTAQKIDHGPIQTMGTPRRLAVMINDLADKGQDATETVSGPPKRAAYDADGNPTKAGLGFAKGQGVEFSDLIVIDTPKGEYLAAKKFIPGRPSREALAEGLPGLIMNLPFPKSMRWGAGEYRFARPIHWLVVLLGEQVVEMELAGINSGRTTYGHRFNAPEPIELASPDDYIPALEAARVIVDIARRKEIVLDSARKAAVAEGGRLLEDEELTATSANLVEFPTAVCGRFDDEFLKLPDQVLITSMKEHQKYFAVTDDEGRLKPNFVAINNTVARDPEVVKKGHQKVIRARLADAAFFWEEDRKIKLEDRVEDLKAIVYHKNLGTSYQKVERFAGLAAWLAERIAPQAKEAAVKSAWLAKADLTSLMVGEFPSLQGVIGAAYAADEGLAEAIVTGIGQHYLPTSGAADAALPQSDTGALIALADKMDTVTGMFAIGKPPSGGADPFGLRRAALGVIRILIDRAWPISLAEFIDHAVHNSDWAHVKFKTDPAQTAADIGEFFRGRMRNLFTAQGLAADVAEAVLAYYWAYPAGAKARAEALQAFKDSAEFEEAAIAFKRLFNILKGISDEVYAGGPDPAKFEDDAERALHQAASDLADRVRAEADKGDFTAVLADLTGLKPTVDTFFDQVMVMTEDEALRQNRLALVAEVAGLFKLVADFARLQTG